ncbi:hypothetical protein KJF94_08885 [Pseudomonas hormoni]|uniref:Tyr recombinase domain-containing protein n=1 Tax=Pseudomonas hormoni TaxID=3093767 RepID=A0ABX8F528_9PSED|nr:hypothetical protein [Pseudomonas hormoni]QVW25643.1 hypothetical protein KJF94_08885 [Pseudomonas hormoni]
MMLEETPSEIEPALTKGELNAVIANVLRRGDAMELALLELSLVGVRMHELLTTRLKDFREPSGFGVLIQGQKRREGNNLCTLICPPSNALRAWVLAGGIRDGDLLFPDPHYKIKPLSVFAFKKIVSGWFRGIDLGSGEHNFRSLRRSLISKPRKDG